MSFISTPNQPILFDQSADTCACGEDTYAQLVDSEDTVFFQVELNCTSEPFYATRDNLTVWISEGGFICNDGTSGGSYLFEVEPDDIYTTFQMGLTVTEVNAGILYVFFAGGQQYEITSPGDYVFYFNTTIMDTDLTPLITLSGDTFDGCFLADEPLGLSVVGLRSDYRFFIIDENDDVVIDNADYYQVTENKLTVGFDMDLYGIEAGCYRIAYSDSCANVCGQFRITNGYFTYNGGWTILSGAVINASANNLEFTQSGVNLPRAISEMALCEDVEYYVEFKINSISPFASVQCSIGDSLLLSENTVGVHSGVLTSTSGTDFTIRLNGVDGDTAVVDYVIVRFSDESTPIISGTSNVIQVGEFNGCEYAKLEGCNGENSFGFSFIGSGFLPGIRVKTRFFRAQYSNEVESYQDSEGRKMITYAESTKVKTLRIEQQPEYVFDFLNILLLFDNFYVNGVLYFPNEPSTFSPQWNDANALGSVEIDLIKKNGILRKTQCVETDAACLPSVLSEQENYLLLQNGDRVLLQNGDNLLLQG